MFPPQKAGKRITHHHPCQRHVHGCPSVAFPFHILNPNPNHRLCPITISIHDFYSSAMHSPPHSDHARPPCPLLPPITQHLVAFAGLALTRHDIHLQKETTS